MINDKNNSGLSKRSPLRKTALLLRDAASVQEKVYFIYILKCDRGVLYTGIATDYKRRFYEHAEVDGSKRGAKFTKSHKPEKIVAVWRTKTRSDASKLESRIKQLTKSDKELLINDNSNFKIFFSKLIDCRKYRRVKINNSNS